MPEIDFCSSLHKKTSRNYLERVVEHDKADCASVAIQWGEDYWDGDRRYGFGGYRYDGRWRPVAQAMVDHYGLGPTSRVLDIGCGKGFLLYEFTQVVPGIEVVGIDISEYALQNAKAEVKDRLQLGNVVSLPFADASFDLAYSITTLHNLYTYDLHRALGELQRVATDKYMMTESYRNEQEKVNLLYWQLTCRAFHTPAEWEWLFSQAGYSGDYSYIFFE